ncbi:Cytoplasmic dynein 2 heavy chain 1, partial [Pseudolycoriella hygida]
MASFQRIDKDFRYIMREISNDPRILSVSKINNLSTIIESLENQLSKCQSTLASFILTKRNSFPRFYFLANDDLLEMLGQSTKIEIIQKHIKKIIPGVHELGVSVINENCIIEKIFSVEGDEVVLKNKVEMCGLVEDWLKKLVLEIRLTLIDAIKTCSQADVLRQEQIQCYPIQVLCTAKALWFTKITEKSITSMTLQSHLNTIKNEVESYSAMLIDATDSLFCLKIRSILIDLVHHVAIVESLIANNVTNVQDWFWLQQIKYYMSPNQTVIVKMVYAEFEYSYEFLGNPNKLVNTKLTHNCYLTLTQAMHLGLGGNPFGPAGTGKTECVKALGAMLGRLVLVFNCNENVDTHAIGLILSGLAQCGAWGCFDEFNRLKEETLSAISMIIQPLQTAIKEKQKNVTILDESIPLNHHCGMFVTLNPAGQDYGGRQNLPYNLQALFRPIVMQQPEPKDIAKVMLFVEGFKAGNEIGNRMVELFRLAANILSPQRHYEWGLREMKTVLYACGKLLRDNRRVLQADEEMELAVEALRSNTMSKLNQSDCHLFDMLIDEVFPSIKKMLTSQEQLKKCIEDAFSTLDLLSNEKQTEKCIQLYEQLEKRMGVVLLGPPRCGKTTIISVLKQALTSMSKTIRTYTIAPKSMNRTQLLGKLDPDTRQWHDGVLTTTAIVVNAEKSATVSHMLICDGDVDPEWIEALNSVLDDNKLLTLPSGWRIQFGNNVNFVFETHDLSNASPATISRMGIVNLSESDLDPSIIIEAWLKKRSNLELTEYFMEDFHRAIAYIEKLNKKSLMMSKVALVHAGLEFVSACSNREEFCVGLARGLGSTLQHADRNEFCLNILESADIYVPNKNEADLCCFNAFQNKIEYYSTDLAAESDQMNKVSSMLIKTAHMKMFSDVVRQFMKNQSNSPFLIIGPSGCGKSLLVQTVSSEYSGTQLIVINCSGQLTAESVLHALQQNCLIVSGIRGREYKPKLTKLILYLKNINLCYIDSYGTSEVVELLLQLIHRKGFYATNTLEWISVNDLQIGCSLTYDTKVKLSPRFMAIVQLLVLDYPKEDDLRAIIKSQLVPVYNAFSNDSNKMTIDNAAKALIAVHSSISERFTLSQCGHYAFTPKMLTQCIVNLLNYPKEDFRKACVAELTTTFRNRLVNENSVQQFNDIIRGQFTQSAGVDSLNSYFVPSGPKSLSYVCMPEEEWNEIVTRNVAICCSDDVLIELPITRDILHLTSFVCSVLSQPGKHILLCGMNGSGRKDSLHVVCTFLQIKIFSPTPVKNYKIEDFYNDLRMVMQTSVLEDQVSVFHVDHAWLCYLPEMMKPIEAILEGSEIPELFGDEIETIANPLRNAAQLEGYQESITSYFWRRMKNNVHIVITLETSTKNLNETFGEYPSLYRNTEMLYLQPTTTHESISKAILQLMSAQQRIDIPLTSFPTDGSWETSPRRFTQLIKSYGQIYVHYFKKMREEKVKLQAGVDKLSSAHSVVETLKAEAQEQEIALADKRKLANQALEMISSTMRNATDQRTDLLELKQKTQESSQKLIERKKAIEIELKDVEPILKEASAAVGQIKGEALSEIRSLRAPPEIIRDILEGVLRLMGIRDTSWNSMKSFLAKRGVKEDIRSLDPARISAENCSAVEKLLQSKADSFEQKNAKRASVAAAPLAAWVIANVKYSKVVQSIKPLEREQNVLKKNLEEAEGQIQSLTSGLDDVDARVKELSVQLNLYTQEAAVLEIKLNEARSTLQAAEVLVQKLSSEYSSWNDQLDALNNEFNNLANKSYLIAINITHLSHYTYEHRISFMTKILNELHVTEFNVMKNIITDQDIIMWESMGLTADAQSMENAALLSQMLKLPFGTAPIPLLTDPTGCAHIWLSKYLNSQSIPHEICNQNSDRFTYTLELAIRFGKCLIIQDVQLTKPPLLSILYGELKCRFNKKYLQVASKLVDFHEDFKLVLVSRLSKIDVGMEVGAFVTNIPFTTTVSGYTDQLMARSIQLKQPELEEKRLLLLQNEGQLGKQKLELQEKLLVELSSATGDILKNELLLKTLNEVKESSSSIDQSLIESGEIRRQLMQEYDQFKSVCGNAAKFFVGINKIYKITVTVFTNLFLKSISHQNTFVAETSYTHLIQLCYSMLSRAISSTDQLMLGLHICKFAYSHKVPDKEWELFITNFMSSEDVPQTIPPWIKKELHSKIACLITNYPEFFEILQLDNESMWMNYANGSNDIIPTSSITEFQKILVTQMFHPSQLINVISSSVAKLLQLSNAFTTKPTIQQIATESQNENPILLIASGGMEPAKEIEDYVAQKLGKNKFLEISIGKGQEISSLITLKKAANEGLWLCIKNIHLVPHWLEILSQELDVLEPNQDFRLWLVCDSIKNFPESLLIKCNQIKYESPSGVKNKLLRLLQQWTPMVSQKRDPKIMKLYIITFILNSVVQERRSYIPQGWSKFYNFSESDLRTAMSIVRWTEKSSNYKVDWSVIRGLCQHIAYGGRIDNQQDLQLLLTILEHFFDENVLSNHWSPLQFKIVIPQSSNIMDYSNVISHLPDVEVPDIFGLPTSTNISKDLLFCRNLLKRLKSN